MYNNNYNNSKTCLKILLHNNLDHLSTMATSLQWPLGLCPKMISATCTCTLYVHVF